MDHVTTPLLENRRILRTRDFDETRAFLVGKAFRLDVPRQHAHRLDVRLNGVYLPGGYLGYNQYGAAMAVRVVPARGDYWIQFPLRGHGEIVVGAHDIACTPRRTAVSSPTRDYVVRMEADSARLQLSLTGEALTRHLATLLGEAPKAPLEFSPEMDLTTGYGLSLARYLRMVASEFERADSMFWNPVMMTQLDQFLMTGLLLSQPHNYSNALRRVEQPIMPRDVKRVLDFVAANAASPISIADLVAIANVPGRTLFKHFTDFKGTSPMRHVRHIRLDNARDALRSASPDESVIEIAIRCGFSHMGRFAVEYRKRFGEHPSRTLRSRPPLRH